MTFLTEDLNAIAQAISEIEITKPEGTFGITSNGTFDIAQYAEVSVSVQDEPDPELDAANELLESVLNGTYQESETEQESEVEAK